MADVKYLIEVDATGAVKSVKDFDATMGTLPGTAAKAGTGIGGMWKQMALGQAAVGIATKMLKGLQDQMASCINEAIGQEKADRALQSALEITGRTVQGNLQHYIDFASAQQRLTTFTDDEIEAAQALMLTFAQLDQKGTDQAIKGAMGLAKVLGIDLQGATMMVTKAMEGNYVGLGKVGIKVSETMTATQKHNYVMERLAALYPAATKETETFGGKLTQLKNSWGEVQEGVGRAIIGNESFQKALADLKTWLDKISNSPDFKLWLSTVIDGMVAIAKAAGYVVTGLRNITLSIAGANKADKEYVEAQRLLEEALKRNTAAGGHLEEKIKKIMEGHKAAVPVINQVGTRTKVLTAEEVKAGEAAKKWADGIKAIVDRARPLEAAIEKLKKDQADLNAGLKSGTITAAEHAIGTKGLADEYARLVIPVASADNALLKFAMDGRNKVIPTIGSIVTATQKAGVTTKKTWSDAAADWVKTNQAGLNKVMEITKTVTAGIDMIIQQSTNNRMLNLDQEYQKRLEVIKNSTMSEEAKNKAIEALDAEYSIKRRGVLREAAQQGKMVAIVNAIINTAEGMTKALAQGGIFGPILAAIVGAFGAIQIALIRAQPIPLAKGAIFKQKARLTSQTSGQEYDVAEAGEAEIVSSPRRLREAIMGPGAGGGAGQPIILQNHIYLDGRELKAFTTKAVREAGALGYLGAFGKAVTQ